MKPPQLKGKLEEEPGGVGWQLAELEPAVCSGRARGDASNCTWEVEVGYEERIQAWKGCPALTGCPGKVSLESVTDKWMWCLGMCFDNGLGRAGWMVGLNHLN